MRGVFHGMFFFSLSNGNRLAHTSKDHSLKAETMRQLARTVTDHSPLKSPLSGCRRGSGGDPELEGVCGGIEEP